MITSLTVYFAFTSIACSCARSTEQVKVSDTKQRADDLTIEAAENELLKIQRDISTLVGAPDAYLLPYEGMRIADVYGRTGVKPELAGTTRGEIEVYELVPPTNHLHVFQPRYWLVSRRGLVIKVVYPDRGWKRNGGG